MRTSEIVAIVRCLELRKFCGVEKLEILLGKKEEKFLTVIEENRLIINCCIYACN